MDFTNSYNCWIAGSQGDGCVVRYMSNNLEVWFRDELCRDYMRVISNLRIVMHGVYNVKMMSC